MPTLAKPNGNESFVKVAECLYRYTASGGYYALMKRGGKQIRRSLRTHDRKLAERRLADLRRQADRIDPNKGKALIRFEEMAGQWLDSIASGLKESSGRRRGTSIAQLRKYFNGVNLRAITRRDCENWAKGRSTGIAASTFNNERESLIAIFDYAEGEGVILDNPARHLKRRRQGRRELVIPSKEQYRKLIVTMRAMDIRYQRAADLVELLACSGMRKGEANAFRWRDIDWGRGLFVVSGGKRGTKNLHVRHVPLFPVLSALLERLQTSHPEADQDALVVPGQSAKKAIDAACQAAELPHFNHHSMRHYFVSNCIEAGVDFKTIAAWVGHSDGGVLVAQTYGHLRDTHSFEMAQRITE